MASQKMSNLEIIPAINFSNGATKKPNAVMMAAYASGQSIKSMLKLFTFKGYSMRCVFYSPKEIKLLIFEHSKKDKDTGNVVVTTIMQPLTLSMNDSEVWSASTLFNANDANKLALVVPTKLHDYPLIPLAEQGIYPKDRLHPTLSFILQVNYGMKSDEADNTATGMLSFVVDRPVYHFLSPKQMVKAIETEAMQATRLIEWEEKQARKELAAASTQNDKF